MTLPSPPNNRKLGLSGVALTKARNNPNDTLALTRVRDEVERVMTDSGYLDGAPFSWVTIAVRYGLEDAKVPKYQRISLKYGDLPLSIEVDTHRLLAASLEDLMAVFRTAVLRALIDAGKKYDRPTDSLERLLESELEPGFRNLES